MTLQKSVEWMDKLSSLINPPQMYVCVCVSARVCMRMCVHVRMGVCACMHMLLVIIG